MAKITWTDNQMEAIYKEGTNIIVSAGAGSGKTAVLSERILQKLLKGVRLDELLVLTFTKNAAQEMKQRIKKKILNEEKLSHLASDVDNAFITNFDSYTLYLVKKYHYLIGISKDVTIIDENILTILKREFLNNYFEKQYEENTDIFSTFIDFFTSRDDKDIIENIIYLSKQLDLKFDKVSYLKNYISNYYSSNNINQILKDYYENIIQDKLDELTILKDELLDELDGEAFNKHQDYYDKILDTSNYDELKNVLLINRAPSLPKNSDEITKAKKNKVGEVIKDIKKYLNYDSEEIILKELEYTKHYAELLVKILLDLDKYITNYKFKHSAFEFIDLSKLLLKLLQENEEVLNEIKYSLNEILVDEYQDTSDVQEEFIKLISNNNVYMVGDIKQSIYRFRNANPKIFKDKYDLYKQNLDGYKIDLTNNFRSRLEVVDAINTIFNKLMSDGVGGANYKKEHQMIYGNKTYLNEGKLDFESKLLIHGYYNYEERKDDYTKDEYEIFYILNDIKKKISEKYPVYDDEIKTTRPCTYKDFTILSPTSTPFDLYKKIFELNDVPTKILKDDELTNDTLIYLFKNILLLIKSLYLNEYNDSFKHAFVSVARSFLINYEDDKIYTIIKNNSIKDILFIKELKKLSYDFNYLTNKELLKKIIEIFDVNNKLINIDNISKNNKQIQYFFQYADSMNNLGLIGVDFIDSLIKVLDNELNIKISNDSSSNENKVTLMTIHKSKGLEFSITYFSNFYKQFNTKEYKQKFLYDNKYGLIIPFCSEIETESITKKLMKYFANKEDISEKIRLFYVALTRAKEKAIIITPIEMDEAKRKTLKDYDKLKIKSFSEMIDASYDVITKYLEKSNCIDVNIDTSYRYISTIFRKTKVGGLSKQMIYRNIETSFNELNKIHISKEVENVLDKNEAKSIELGLRMHEALECLDFINPNYDKYSVLIQEKLKSFLSDPLLINIKEAIIFKEYEFLYKEDSNTYQGIIDLFLVYKDHIDVIDYKLKNINDMNYIKQLNSYKAYLSKKFNLPINIYLYSILEEKFESLNTLKVEV